MTKKFMLILLAVHMELFLFSNAYADEGKGSSNEFSFGVIADCQYCEAPSMGNREYSFSAKKLQKCIDHLDTMDLKYVVDLGDLIDQNFNHFDLLNSIYSQLKIPHYNVLGNHDFSVKDELKKDVPQKLGLSSKYYDFGVTGWRFIVLDGNDISFYAYPKDSEKHEEAAEYYLQNQIESPKWNGAVGGEQMEWLQTVLEKASQEKEKVILYCHFPVYPVANKHNLWNADEVITLIESFPCVKAYINGHNHKGAYEIKEGIHYLTLKGMVETEQTAYSVITVRENSIQVTGYGLEKDRMMEIRK